MGIVGMEMGTTKPPNQSVAVIVNKDEVEERLFMGLC